MKIEKTHMFQAPFAGVYRSGCKIRILEQYRSMNTYDRCLFAAWSIFQDGGLQNPSLDLERASRSINVHAELTDIFGLPVSQNL